METAQDFAKYEKMIWAASHKQSKKTGRDVDEFFSLSCLEFAKVSKKWQNRKDHTVAFSTYLLTSINWIFINEGLKRKRDGRISHEGQDAFINHLEQVNSGVSMEETLSFEDQVGHLSDDAQEVVQVTYNKDHKLDKVNKTFIKAYFSDLGWKNNRIDAAFQEIHNMLEA